MAWEEMGPGCELSPTPLAEYLDLSLGDLLEGIVLHAFEGRAPFQPETLAAIEQLRAVFGLELTAADSHRLTEAR